MLESPFGSSLLGRVAGQLVDFTAPSGRPTRVHLLEVEPLG
jgi:transcription elongation GreA/GreB family factor